VRWLFVLILFAACHAAERPVLVRSADVAIVVDDTAETLTSVVESVEAAGGYVVESNAWREEGRLRASIVLRVPEGELMRTLARIRGEALQVDREVVASAADAPLPGTPSRLDPLERHRGRAATVPRHEQRR
jgi:hypothetical protein